MVIFTILCVLLCFLYYLFQDLISWSDELFCDDEYNDDDSRGVRRSE